MCIGIGGIRVDKAVAAQIIEAVSGHAVDAAIRAVHQSAQVDADIRLALCRELEEARFDASLAARRYEAVDPAKRLVARELENRWNTALERVAALEERINRHDAAALSRPKMDEVALMALARDLPAVWNAPGTDAGTRQPITYILIREVLVDLDDTANEAVVTIHWIGGRHTELRISRVRCGRYPEGHHVSPVDAVRKIGGQWPDREVAGTLNRMRCKPADGKAWTTVRVRDLREQLGIASFDPKADRPETISVDQAAKRLEICVGSVHKLIREGTLPATQLIRSAPWQIPVAALTSDSVRLGVQEIVDRRPCKSQLLQDDRMTRLPNL
ncbi:MAG: helix-turn-helix domain-containing protein [Rhodopila sp.]|nr:helix-turn-helix domain-containing protein [Rhodopila sp.]